MVIEKRLPEGAQVQPAYCGENLMQKCFKQPITPYRGKKGFIGVSSSQHKLRKKENSGLIFIVQIFTMNDYKKFDPTFSS